MKKITVGILANVDAGKTTLSEGLLFSAGEIRRLGRVDSKDTFLDTDEIERARGITVFSKQAVITGADSVITLLDTPGHVDFVAETERTLRVLDYAILVISASDGVSAHTKTLWELLKSHNIPVFLFINKTDLDGVIISNVEEELKTSLDSRIINFATETGELLYESIALCDEEVMHGYLENGIIDKESITDLISARKLFPAYSGSALKMNGVREFLEFLFEYTKAYESVSSFGARVFKISRDEKERRLTFMKITGGEIKVKELINNEKINEIRIYSGEKYSSVQSADKGTVCAVTGLENTYAGQGLGFEESSDRLTAEPIFTYKVLLPDGIDAPEAFADLKKLEQEETQLGVSWNPQLKEIQLKLMGEIQLEILKTLIQKKFGYRVEFETGGIVYKETIAGTVEGIGHYEPLRHYSEVHLLLEPLKEGSGMEFTTDCSEDLLDKNWQRLILSHMSEKKHIGVLTGAPLTDIRITLKSGKAHNKHTEGGDFRQATYRAIRQGLMKAKSVLLEPYYEFTLEVPAENTGRAMTDLDRMGAELSSPLPKGNMTVIRGTVPASEIADYNRELIAYTHGHGKLNCKFKGYSPCHNAEKIIEEKGYNPEADLENSPDSVFCANGAGFTVKWDSVEEYMHLESVLKPKKEIKEPALKSASSIQATDEELLRIFERTYGKVETRLPGQGMRKRKELPESVTIKSVKKYDKEYLLIDGYNIIFAWDELKNAARDNLEDGRRLLIEKLSSYKVFRDAEIIVVFDAYKVKRNAGEMDRINGITIVYTKEAQTADSYIEKTAKELSKNYKVTVATSDNLEQLIVFGSGAYTLSAEAFRNDIERVESRIRELIRENNITKKENVLEELIEKLKKNS